MRVFAVSGLSGTGKTTVVEQLVEALRSKGYSVATVKSSREDYSSPEGTDSWRHERAGANPVILLGPHTTSVRYGERLRVSQIIKEHDIDFLLVEGMKEEELPKAWCAGRKPFDSNEVPSTAVAVVTWEGAVAGPRSSRVPVLGIKEIEKLTQIVLKEAVDISKLRI